MWFGHMETYMFYFFGKREALALTKKAQRSLQNVHTTHLQNLN